MKQFAFPLQRILDWRRTQLRLEETRLSSLRTELIAIEVQTAKVRQDIARNAALVRAGTATRTDLEALSAFARFSRRECERLEKIAADWRARIAKQTETVLERRRDVKLLEQLAEKALTEWRLETGREEQREAEDRFLAQRKRSEIL